MNNNLYFDIETKPLPFEQIAQFIPDFDESEVKIGNMKDQAKIAAKIASAKEKHSAEYLRQAALYAVTGQVCAIGMEQGGEFRMLRCATEYDNRGEDAGEDLISAQQKSECMSEREMLEIFTERAASTMAHGGCIVHFNGHRFDLPFIIRRGWKYGIAPIPDLRRDRYWSRQSVDLFELWSLGEYRESGGLRGVNNLNAIALHLGLAGKNGNGEFFYKMPLSQKFNYLRGDVAKVVEAHKRMML